ncbi:ETC complex I subunit [Sphingorhabdus lutea]|uniref:ETC complex I subunit n=1 Tax=Sphingorhabdus lutea TaxID=1913578 RepID=A0A1L3JBK5_9SPHN|nr:NADH dehydrogenase ubiquinone Fe-S protein 4 [Sphingorhabdus lutea]APG62511.1 ETC complex I subunit [Sphingorhabdus lutea]
MPAQIVKKATIYQRPKNAMQSGKARMSDWVLEFPQNEKRHADPLMGWSGSGDTQVQVQLNFPNLAAAQDYAARKGIKADVVASPAHKLKIQAYSDNFR